MKSTSDKAGLELLLRDMYEALAELALVLDNEHQALENTDVEKLQQAAIDKERLSSKLDKLEKSRTDMLRQAHFGLDKESMSRFITAIAGTGVSSLTKIWDMAEELAYKCDTQNKLNGIVIDNTRRQTQAALSILQGHQATEDKLYDADGASVAQSFNSTLARA